MKIDFLKLKSSNRIGKGFATKLRLEHCYGVKQNMNKKRNNGILRSKWYLGRHHRDGKTRSRRHPPNQE